MTVDGQGSLFGQDAKKPWLRHAAAIDDKNGFGLVEVTGKKLPDSADFGSPGALEVIEAEIYEPLAASAQ